MSFPETEREKKSFQPDEDNACRIGSAVFKQAYLLNLRKPRVKTRGSPWGLWSVLRQVVQSCFSSFFYWPCYMCAFIVRDLMFFL